MEVIFLLGRESQEQEGEPSTPLEEEQELYGDLLQEDFVDHYANLSLK